jgi:hypothetical protein
VRVVGNQHSITFVIHVAVHDLRIGPLSLVSQTGTTTRLSVRSLRPVLGVLTCFLV